MSLDPTSSDFDPEAALRDPENVILPNPNIRPFNNVAEYVSRTRGLGRARGPRPTTLFPSSTARGQKSQVNKKNSDNSLISAFGARFEHLKLKYKSADGLKVKYG